VNGAAFISTGRSDISRGFDSTSYFRPLDAKHNPKQETDTTRTRCSLSPPSFLSDCSKRARDKQQKEQHAHTPLSIASLVSSAHSLNSLGSLADFYCSNPPACSAFTIYMRRRDPGRNFFPAQTLTHAVPCDNNNKGRRHNNNTLPALHRTTFISMKYKSESARTRGGGGSLLLRRVERTTLRAVMNCAPHSACVWSSSVINLALLSF